VSSVPLRLALKKTAMRTLRSAGVYSIAARSERRKNRLLILCYHGISVGDEHEWLGFLFVSPKQFRNRLACLRDAKANVLPLGEAITRLENGTLPDRSVAITFDDGFHDFQRYAVPLLNEFGFPCTLYLTTYYSGLPFPIINLAFDYLLWKCGRETVAVPETSGVGTKMMPLRTWMDRQQAKMAFLAYFEAKGMSTGAKDEFARSFAEQSGVDYDALLCSRFGQILTPEEAVQVAHSGIEIELHTHRHRTPSDRDLFLRELRDNSARIQEITGKTPHHFCYPSGRYDRQFLPWLRDFGVTSATTCERGFALPSSEPLLLPRVLDDSNMDPIEFEGIVSGLFA
jgi:peptidoglycan/xylan/chitin deacetylase (PgdA/CDA1 family)